MSVSPKQFADIVVHAPECDCVVGVSAPGTGKSSMVLRAALRMGARHWPVYTPTMEALDARGLPTVENKTVEWAAPTFLPLAKDADRYRGQTILVNFDDWFQAPPPVLRATVRSIYEVVGEIRKVGDFEIYPNVRFVGTGNREQDRAGVYRPETYVNDRLTYVEVEPNVDEYVSGAINGFALPGPDEAYAATRAAINKAVALGIPEVLIAFVKRNNYCYNFDAAKRSFLSPRSIERLGRFMRAFDAAGINGELLREVACGTIGDEDAMKFMGFLKYQKAMPDVQAILRGEDVPLDGLGQEVFYITATSIIRSARKEHAKNVAKFVMRLSEATNHEGLKTGVEASVYLFKECLHGAGEQLRGVRAEVISNTKWLQRNGQYFQ